MRQHILRLGLRRSLLAFVGLCVLVAWGCTPPPDIPNTSGNVGDSLAPGTRNDPPPPRTTNPTNPTKPTPTTGPEPEPDPPAVPSRSCSSVPRGSWSGASTLTKRQVMECEVLPKMLDIFMRHDPRYAAPGAFHCQTCHGEGAQSEGFDFSSPTHLYPLDPNNMPTENDKDPKIAAAVVFMKYEVLPLMQKLLNNSSLTCFSCHAKK